MMKQRRYPFNIQTFSRMRNDGYVYVDKTDVIWDMVNFSNYVFLSRPRRFGKSLLSSTLHSYFDGDREVFEGLKIMELETEWKRYPVIHLDLSKAKGQQTADGLREKLFVALKPYTKEYGREKEENQPGSLLEGIINRACEQNSSQVAVIIDEYDAPLLDALDKPELLEELRNVMQEFYVPLKAADPVMKFCFITGITKLSQLSIFSTINNLKNISMLPRFATICGITDEEIDNPMKATTESSTPMMIVQRAMRGRREDILMYFCAISFRNSSLSNATLTSCESRNVCSGTSTSSPTRTPDSSTFSANMRFAFASNGRTTMPATRLTARNRKSTTIASRYCQP